MQIIRFCVSAVSAGWISQRRRVLGDMDGLVSVSVLAWVPEQVRGLPSWSGEPGRV
jgi:hypothetical protein